MEQTMNKIIDNIAGWLTAGEGENTEFKDKVAYPARDA
jgi:hypothetical protein